MISNALFFHKRVDMKKNLRNGLKVWRKTLHRSGVKCRFIYIPALKHGKHDCLADHPVFVSDTRQKGLQQQSVPAWRNLSQSPGFLFLYLPLTVEGESPGLWLKMMVSQHQLFPWSPSDMFNSPSKVSRILWSPESEWMTPCTPTFKQRRAWFCHPLSTKPSQGGFTGLDTTCYSG